MATEIATLGIRIEDGQVVKAESNLKQLGATGDAVNNRLQRGLVLTSSRLREYQRDLALMNADLKSGKLGTDAYARSLAVMREQLQAVQLSSRMTTKELATYNGLLKATDPVASKAGGALGGMTRHIEKAALVLGGVNDKVAGFVSRLSGLASGGGIMTGVVIGLGALALAWQKLTENTRKAREAYDEYIKGLTRQGPLAIVGAKLDVERNKLAELQASPLANTQDLKKQINEQQALVDRLRVEYAKLYEDNRKASHQHVEALNQETEAVGRQIARLHDMNDALAALNKTFDLWLKRQQQPTLFTISSVTGRSANRPAAPEQDLAAMERIAAKLTADTLKVLPVTEDIAESWGDTARSALGAAQAIGGMSDQSLLLLHNAVATAEAFEKLDSNATKAGLQLSAGGIFGAAGAAAGLISSIAGLFGGGEDPRDRQIRVDNTKAIRELTRTMQAGVSGSTLNQVSAAIAALQSAGSLQPRIGNLGGPSRSDINRVLGPLGLTFQQFKDLLHDINPSLNVNTSSMAEFQASLEQLAEAMRAVDLQAFTNDFAGILKAMDASFTVFSITDPAKQLEALAAASGAFIGGIRDFFTGEITNRTWIGSPALRNAAAGLDLGSLAGQQTLRTNLQGLFTQLQAGQITADQLGGMSAQEFLDSLTRMIDLINQAEEAAKANAEAQRATANMLREFSSSLKLGPLSTLSPVQQLVEARRQYDAVLQQALAGDQAAANRIPQLAQQFLEASRAVNASGPAYAADFARVLADSDALAALFDAQAGILEQQLGIQQNIATNTAQTVEQLQATVAVLSQGLQATIDKLDEINTETAQQTILLRKGLTLA